MSEENAQNPSLRLKPRIRVEPAQTPPPPRLPIVPPSATGRADADAPAPSTSDDEISPVSPPPAALPPPPTGAAPRLRPKILTPEPLPEGAHFAAPLPSAPLPPPVLPDPILPPPAAPAPASSATPPAETLEIGRFKLKPRLSQSETPTLPIASLPPAAISPAPQGIKVVATAPTGNAMPVKPTPFVRAAQPPPAAPESPAKKSGSLSRSFKRNLIALGIFMALTVAIGGFLGLRMMTQIEKKNAEPTPPLKVVIPQHPVNDATIPKTNLKGPVVANPQSLPGKLVGKARDVVAAHDDAMEAAGLKDAEQGTFSAPNKTSPAHAVGPDAKVASTDANSTDASTVVKTPAKPMVVEIKPPTPEPPPPPSAAFKALIVNLRISGVFQGDPPRAFVNGRMVSAGEVFDTSLGVKFVGLDSSKKLLIFQDSTGATVPRRF